MELEDKIDALLLNAPTLGNSKFQMEHFVINKHQTKGRAYRQAILELRERYTALRKARLARKKIEAEINLLEEKFKKQTNDNKKVIISCEIEDKRIDLEDQVKLINDSIEMCNFLYSGISKMGSVSSEEFEKEEHRYWAERLIQDAKLSVLSTGVIKSDIAESLKAIGINPIEAQLQLQVQNQNEIRQLIEIKKKEQDLFLEKQEGLSNA